MLRTRIDRPFVAERSQDGVDAFTDAVAGRTVNSSNLSRDKLAKRIGPIAKLVRSEYNPGTADLD